MIFISLLSSPKYDNSICKKIRKCSALSAIHGREIEISIMIIILTTWQVPEPVPEEPPQVEVQPPVSDSQPPFDNSPYQPPSPPPAPPAVSTANQAVVQAPPGRPQRPLPTSKPHRPNGRPPVAVQPVFHPPVELTVPDEQPALVYSDSSTTADGGYSFE